MTKQAVVIGVGASNGLGAALARRFAKEGLETVVSGRTREKLDLIVSEIDAAGGAARAVTADATQESDIKALFDKVAAKGEIAAVLYNAGNNAIIPFEDLTPQQFEKFWRLGPFGGFLAAKAAMPILMDQGYGSMIFTGASASMRGRPNFAHFASAKAGLRMLAQSLARTYGPQNIHVAHVIVDGVIDGERIRAIAPEYLDHLGESGSINPDEMAEAFWQVHAQPKSAWTHELDIRPFKETW
ncbi:MAG: SDR family NAD(P)-dependent oxidoreductase [Henriciella sp.]|nr:SDR family NAD(P)-dependent oxidoreductase [Henriciella sp.]